MMAVGLHDAFALIEEVGREVLSEFEMALVSRAEEKFGCVLRRDLMTKSERTNVMEFGQRCLAYKMKNRPRST